MALDEPKEEDEIMQSEGFRLLVDKKLLEESGGVEMDYNTGPFQKGFQVKGKNKTPFGC